MRHTRSAQACVWVTRISVEPGMIKLIDQVQARPLCASSHHARQIAADDPSSELHLYFRSVLRVGQLGDHQQPELFVIRHCVVPQTDHVLPPLLKLLLQQDRLEGSIQFLHVVGGVDGSFSIPATSGWASSAAVKFNGGVQPPRVIVRTLSVYLLTRYPFFRKASAVGHEQERMVVYVLFIVIRKDFGSFLASLFLYFPSEIRYPPLTSVGLSFPYLANIFQQHPLPEPYPVLQGLQHLLLRQFCDVHAVRAQRRVLAQVFDKP